jgi:hypothetical protein
MTDVPSISETSRSMSRGIRERLSALSRLSGRNGNVEKRQITRPTFDLKLGPDVNFVAAT